MRVALPIIVLAAVGGLAACSGERGDFYVGKMSDRSYGGQVEDGICLERPDATGHPTCIDRFAGRFVWTDYAAPWCAPCAVQARIIRELEKDLGDEIVFLTVLTGDEADVGSIATVETARDWSNRFGLDPSRVVVAENLWSMSLPTHVLYSPIGQSLYRSSGFMRSSEIREIIRERASDWRAYERTRRRASWMR